MGDGVIVGGVCAGCVCLFIAILGAVFLGLSLSQGSDFITKLEGETAKFDHPDVRTESCLLDALPSTPSCQDADICVNSVTVGAGHNRGTKCTETSPGIACKCRVSLSRIREPCSSSECAQNFTSFVDIGAELKDKVNDANKWCADVLAQDWANIHIEGQTHTACEVRSRDPLTPQQDGLEYITLGGAIPDCLVDLRPGKQVDCVKMPQDGRIMLGSKETYMSHLSESIEKGKKSNEGMKIAGIVLLCLPGLVIVLACCFATVMFLLLPLCDRVADRYAERSSKRKVGPTTLEILEQVRKQQEAAAAADTEVGNCEQSSEKSSGP